MMCKPFLIYVHPYLLPLLPSQGDESLPAHFLIQITCRNWYIINLRIIPDGEQDSRACQLSILPLHAQAQEVTMLMSSIFEVAPPRHSIECRSANINECKIAVNQPLLYRCKFLRERWCYTSPVFILVNHNTHLNLVDHFIFLSYCSSTILSNNILSTIAAQQYQAAPVI